MTDWRGISAGADIPQRPTPEAVWRVAYAKALLEGWAQDFPEAPARVLAAWDLAAVVVQRALDIMAASGIVPVEYPVPPGVDPEAFEAVLDRAEALVARVRAEDAGVVCARCGCVVGRRDDDCPDPCGCHGSEGAP